MPPDLQGQVRRRPPKSSATANPNTRPQTRSALDQAPGNERSQAINMEEIKEAVKNLSREDLGIFRKWFWEFDQERWDEEIEEDVKAGRFDSILREVDRDAHES